MAGYQGLADYSSELITHVPHASREEFLTQIDKLMVELENARSRSAVTSAHSASGQGRGEAVATGLQSAFIGK
jgi:hypothetical protein